MLIARILVGVVEGYAAIGCIVAAAFVLFGIARAMPHAGHVTVGARMIIWPAAVGFGPGS